MLKTGAKLIVVSAPSGTGKTTLVKRLLRRNANLVRSISYTTRPPRAGEIDGEDYFFISAEEFRRKEKRGFFLESAHVFGHSYGTSLKLVQNVLRRHDVILAIDVQGMKQIKSRLPHGVRMVSIFIMPPSKLALRRRLAKRRTETKQEMEKRLRIAEAEMNARHLYDYVVVNRRIDHALKAIEGVLK